MTQAKLDEYKIVGKKKISEWEKHIRDLAHQNQVIETSKSKMNLWLWISAIAMVVGIFIPILFFVAIPIFIFCFIKKRAIKSSVSSPRFQTQLLPFLLYLKDEVHTKMPIHLEINTQPFKETKPILSKPGEIRYMQIWLKGRTRLLDGSEIMFIFRDNIRDLTITKRGRISGKTKTKYKTKYKTTFKVKLIADLSRFNKGEGKKTYKLKGFQKTGTYHVMFQAHAFAATLFPVYNELRSGSTPPNTPHSNRPIMK